MDIKNNKHRKYIELRNKGNNNTEACKVLHIAGSTGYQIARKYKEAISKIKAIDNTYDISEYDTSVANSFKGIIMKYANILKDKDLQKVSPSQLATVIGIMYDKLRLHEGKSTANVLHRHIDDYTEKEQKALTEAGRVYKESMLKQKDI